MSRHHQTLSGPRWEATRRAVLDRDGHRCLLCGRPGLLEVHHRIELQAGGSPYDPDNCVTWCRSCHIDHHRRDMSPERAEWRDYIEDLLG